MNERILIVIGLTGLLIDNILIKIKFKKIKQQFDLLIAGELFCIFSNQTEKSDDATKKEKK